jgi:catalase
MGRRSSLCVTAFVAEKELMAQIKSVSSDTLIEDLLTSLDHLFGLHSGFRPVHAKGIMCSGIFSPGAAVTTLTRAPHVNRPTIPVVVRFSNFAGVPTVPDNDIEGASPRGMAIRFYLAEHVHTDIVGHSFNGFPTRTGEEFLEFARALAASGKDAPKPTAIEEFLAKHPKAMHFAEAPKPIPTSYARESYFGVNAYKFTAADGTSRYGRYKIRPEAGNEYLTSAQAQSMSENFLAEECSNRLSKGAIKFRIVVQIAEPADDVSDSTNIWPDSRSEIEFGTITLTERVNDADPEMRKIIFDPIPRVDGIEPSDDPLIEVRAAIYLMSGRRRRAATQ